MSNSSLRLFALIASLTAESAAAQCQQWDPSLAAGSATDYSIHVLAALDDGAGPVLYAGGSFTSIGGTPADGIAKRTGSNWVPIGNGLITGFVEKVQTVTIFDGGSGASLYVGGYFQLPPPGPGNVARWDGSAWQAVGPYLYEPSVPSEVDVLVVADIAGNHGLYAAGTFTMAGTTVVNHVARWNGTSWSALGSGTDGDVRALLAFDDGTGMALYAGGDFTTANGITVNGIARWNGSAWSALGGGVSGDVRTLAAWDDGRGPALYAGGSFVQAGGHAVNHIAKWKASQWSSIAGGVSHPTASASVESLLVADDGTGSALFVGGSFRSAGSVSAERLARWDGSSWSALGSGMDAAVLGLGSFDVSASGGPDVLAIGYFANAGGAPSRPIAEWRGCAAGTPFCAGDGSPVACPCNNQGRHGHGCENSAATGGAFLHATRTLGPDTVVLTATGEIASAFSLFLQSAGIASSPFIFGDGRRCLSGSLKRLYAKPASGGIVAAPGPGDPSILARSSALGDPIPMGATRYYQVAYRDPNPGFCPGPPGGTFNASSGVILRW